MVTYETVHGSIHLHVEISTLGLAKFDGILDESLVSGLVSRREDERRVGRRILGLVDIDRCIVFKIASRLKDGLYPHSKSPESETTTVPVCLRASREVVMVAVQGVVG